jgi:ketol-acid reductoisomerase
MKYGFIGCGNMGSALAKALSKTTTDILLADRSGRALDLAAELGCTYGSNQDAVACQRVFLGVKPQMMADVLRPLQPALAKKKPLLISMAAGLTVERIEELGSHDMFIARVEGVYADEQYMDENGRFDLMQAKPIVYSHGQYYGLGEHIGRFGFSVQKKKKDKKDKKKKPGKKI